MMEASNPSDSLNPRISTAEARAAFLVYCNYLCLSPATIRVYGWATARLVKQCLSLPVSSSELLPVLGDPKDAVETRRDLRRILNRFFGWVEKTYGFPNPVLGTEPIRWRKQLPWVLTEEQIQRLFDVADSRRDRALLAVPLDNGLRVGEIANLTWPDIGDRQLAVEGKVGRRQVPLSIEVRRSLIGLGDGHHIWLGRKGPFTVEGLKQLYWWLFWEAGIRGKKVGPNVLRHTFATLYLRHGGNILMLQDIMGHENIKTTTIYLHLAGVDVSRDHATHSPAVWLLSA